MSIFFLLKRAVFVVFILQSFFALSEVSEAGFSSQESGFLKKDLGFFKKDSAYHIQKITAHWNLIFSEEFKSFSPFLSHSILDVDKKLSSLFKRKPDFRTGHIFFSSPRYQKANARAFFNSIAFVHIYPSSTPIFMDLWAFFDWSRDTLIHEMNHTYQLSQNFYLDNYYTYLLDFVVPASSNISHFVHRNNALPLWILEGDSVLTESIYGSGGRLWSGFSRAFVLSQIKEDKIDLKRLLNFYTDPFSSLEKYLHGGFFFAYLESRYGLKKVKNFFYESMKTIPIGYYGLQWSFRKAFDVDIDHLFESYKKHYRSLARKQRSDPAPVLFTSKAFAPINSDEKSLYFLISDLKSPSELVVWNKEKSQFKKRKAYLPMGKVFKRKGKFLSVSNIRTGTNTVEYTLIKEKFKPVPEYNSQYVMDFYQDQALALDMKKSHQGNFLNLGGEFYDKVHSSALIDSEGSVYYFKQKGEKRILYKNKQALVEFFSYFSYPVEVYPNEVYFIGSTLYGSSLFVYREGQGFYRLSESDRIVSARKIKKNQFLVAEISPSHYEYKLISTLDPSKGSQSKLKSVASNQVNTQVTPQTTPQATLQVTPQVTPQATSLRDTASTRKKTLISQVLSKKRVASFNRPVFYTDLPKKKNLFKKLSLSQEIVLQESRQKHSIGHVKPYHAFSNLRFKKFGLSVFQYNYGFVNFEDTLNFNNLILSGFIFKSNQFFKLSYFHKKYRPQFEISLNYNKGTLFENDQIDTFQDLGFLEPEDQYFKEELEELQEERSKEGAVDEEFLQGFNGEQVQVSRVVKKVRPYLNYKAWALSLGLNYPLYRRSESSFNASSLLTFGQRQFNQNLWIEYFNNKGSLSYNFQRRYPFAYFFYKKRELKAEYSLHFIPSKTFHLSYSIKGSFVEDLGREFFLDVKGKTFWGLWNRTLTPLPLNFLEGLQWSYIFLEESVRNLYQLDMTLFKVFKNNKYRPLKIPFYVNRLSPLFGLSLLSFQKHKELNYNVAFIPSLGGETEFAIVDRNAFRFGFLFELPFFIPELEASHLQFRMWIKSGL